MRMSNFLVIEGYSVDLPEFVDMVVTLLNYATIHKETPPGYVKNICAVWKVNGGNTKIQLPGPLLWLSQNTN